MFFSHGLISSCGVAIEYFGAKSFKAKNIKSDKNERLLLLDAKKWITTKIRINALWCFISTVSIAVQRSHF